MPRNLPTKCKVCGVEKSDTTPISRHGMCYPCGTERMTAALKAQMDAVALASSIRANTTRSMAKPSTPRGVGGTPSKKVKPAGKATTKKPTPKATPRRR